jgi:hypothetical protein
MELITEFFYDIFRRLIPGLVAIFLWRNELAKVFAAHHGFPFKARVILDGHHDFPLVMFIASILLGAWILGFAIQRATGFFCALAGALGRQLGWAAHLKRFRDFVGFVTPRQDEWKTGSDVEREKRRQAFLGLGEKEMSRSLWVIFLSSECIHFYPVFKFDAHLPSTFCFVASLFFFGSWVLGVTVDPEINPDKQIRVPGNECEIEREPVGMGAVLQAVCLLCLLSLALGSVGLFLVGLPLIMIVWLMVIKYVCPKCKNPVASNEVRLCPACSAKLRPGKLGRREAVGL